MSMVDYTYASARVTALESKLLSPSQIELLVSAKGSDELYTVLYDTYLASYLKQNTEQDILGAIEEQIRETKDLLVAIAPIPSILNVLWVKYDYHNVKAIVKGLRMGLSDEDILDDCYDQGSIRPEHLLSLVHAGTLKTHAPELNDTYVRAEQTHGAGAVDELCNAAYFMRIHEMSMAHDDMFLHDYVQALIDIFNIKALARGAVRESFQRRQVQVSGGTCPVRESLDATQVAYAYARYGGGARWQEAVQRVQAGEPVATLEKVADEAFTEWLKEQALLDFGFARIAWYFYAVKNNAQIISAIVKAKRAGMLEKDLRTILRTRQS